MIVGLILGMLLLASCQPLPAPTPTVPPLLDVTVTPPLPAPGSPTPTPSATVPPPDLTASPTPAAPTLTPLVIVLTLTPSPVFAPLETATAPPVTPGPVRDPATPTPLGPALPQPVPNNPAQVVYTPSAAINPLPLPAVINVRELPVGPANTSFDGVARQQGAMEVNVPEGWVAWWRTGEIDCTIYRVLQTTGPCPLFDEPDLRYRRPEFTVIPASGRWLNPPRVLDDGRAARFFCTYGICVAGYLQQVQVVPGEAYVLSAWVHSWCNEGEDPAHSQVETYDDRMNCAMAVGLDPAAGLDPLSDSVVWRTVYAYDTYTYVETPPVTAQGGALTLYLRGRSLWGLKHNDFHFDQVSFVAQ